MMNLSKLQEKLHKSSSDAGWWINGTVDDQVPVKLLLIHSEVSEAMEGHRKSLKDDHLPHRDMMEVELADALIRILDLAGACGYDLEATIEEKDTYNAQRADHKPENRAKAGGKKY